MSLPRNASSEQIEAWYSKVCARYARREITARLFRKFQVQYDARVQKARAK